MAEIDVSVIIPIKNTADNIEKIIKAVIDKNQNINLEFIITDISTDNKSTVAALNTINKYNLQGSVIQCGSNICSALNSGIKKACGRYLSFLFPRRLYTDCITPYLSDAEGKKADFVFGSVPVGSTKDIIIFENASPLEILEGIIYEKLACDIASVLISTKFLSDNSLFFSEELKVGYSEDFIYRVLINCKCAVKSDTVMVRNKELEPEKNTPDLPDKDSSLLCFEKIDAMVNIRDNMSVNHSDYNRIYAVFTGEKIPSAVFSCIDALLKEKYTFKAVKKALKQKNYEDLIKINKYTSSKLKRKIYTWKLTPRMYKYDM